MSAGMSKREAATLRRIVRDRFRLLRKQLPIRERELRQQIADEVDADQGALVAAAEVEGSGLLAEREELEDRISAFVEKNRRAGLKMKGYGTISEWRSVAADKEIRARLHALHTDRARAELTISTQEVGLLELLSAPELESAEAIGFLERIPTIERALTAPSLSEITDGDS